LDYFSELRSNWRALAAAALGIATGYSLNNYLNNIFIPALMQEFGWTSAQIALLGLPALLSIVCQPLAGRLADRFGVTAVAMFGVAMGALVYLALSRIGASFAWYLGLIVVQIALFAATTGPVVYSRLIAESFDKARGLALGIAACSYSVAAVVFVPFVTPFIEREGWRSGYATMALFTVLAGAATLLLIPRRKIKVHSAQAGNEQTDYRAIFANPAFWPIVAGIVLCSLTIIVQTTQMKVILLKTGMASADASLLISVYAAGVIAGRLACGAALDRFPAHIVAMLSMGLPAFGLMLMATGMASPLVQGLAVLLIGLALGAETDVAGFLVMRFFPVGVYSAVLGLLLGALSGAAALGSLILSGILQFTASFAPFLLFAATASLVGSWLFWRLGKLHPV
jgi:MFS family permease